MDKGKDLKIIGLKADGFQNLAAINMVFDPNENVFIRGDNGSGKTSCIKAVEWLIFGPSAIDKNAMGKKSDKMTGTIDLGEFKITRTHPGNKLKIEYPSGLTREKAKQDFLKSLTNPALMFNPMAFFRLSEAEKMKWLMEFMGVDFTEIDQELQSREYRRREIGRDIKGIGDIEEIGKIEPSNPMDLLKKKNNLQEEIDRELQEIRDFNDEQHSKHLAIDGCQEEIEAIDLKVSRAELEIQHLKALLTALEESKKKITEELKSIPVPEEKREVKTDTNTDAIDQEIIDNNDKVVLFERWSRAEEKLKTKAALQEKYDSETEEIGAMRIAKLNILSNSKPDIPGFEILEDGATWNSVSLGRLSESESWEFAMMLLKYTNPRLRAFFIDGGESIGKNRFDQIQKFSDENDIQLIITQVAPMPDESTGNVFFLVDGKVAG